MIGELLGPYRIERELGSGGMGKVYAATDESGAQVAIKIVHPHLLEAPGFFKRFLREAEIGRAVRHPNVVHTRDADQLVIDGTANAFLVMEYVEGQTLRGLLEELERVPEELCRHIGREVAKGLAAIHEAGVVHRDLKPENVLITPEHEVKVMDLGVAQLQNEIVRLSQTGAFVGSIHYAAPEQFGGEVTPDHRVDLHALGLLLYELACGRHPYYDEDYRVVLKQLLHEEPRRIHEMNPQLSPFYEEVVHALLAKDREERLGSATDVARVLEDGEPSDWWQERTRALRNQTKRPLRRIRIPRETSVYGRENELSRLRALFDQAKSGEGQVVLIAGEAGIGKSRLVDEFVGRLQQTGEDINFLFGSYPPGGAALAAGGFSSAYREQLGADGSAPYLTDTPLLVPGFDAVLRGEPPPENAQGLTKDSLQTCFVHATRALAEERPTVVLIDDLHFAPDDARALFTSLALAAPDHRVLLLGTTRPGVPEEWVSNLTRPVHVAHMQVERLGPKDLAALLKDSFRSERLAHALGMRIGEKSDGNPFFIFEIIRGLREGQFITRQDDGAWVRTRVIDDIQIPSSVLDLVSARVAGLTEDERALLDVAACWGYEFDPALVGEVVGLSRIPALRAFGQVERLHRLVRSSGRNYVFDHHQVQEALYGSINEQLREEYHSALAAALEIRTKAADRDLVSLDGALCVDLCEHYLRGSRGEAALRYLDIASSHLTKGYLHAQAVELNERALEVPGLLTGAERPAVLLRLCDSGGPLDMLGWRARQETAAAEAERLAVELDHEDLRCKAALAFGNALQSRGRLTVAQSKFERGLTLAQEMADLPMEARAASCLGVVLWFQGDLTRAHRHFERSLSLARATGHRRVEAGATVNFGLILYSQGRLEEATERFERGLALSREAGHGLFEANATGNLGRILLSQGRVQEAWAQYERYLAVSEKIGYRHGAARATGNLGVILYSLGRLREAREYHDRGLTLSQEIGYREGEALALHNIGSVLSEEGDVARAEERYLACLAMCEEIGSGHLEAATHVVLGALRVAASRVESGRESLERARDLAAEKGAPGFKALALCELACLAGTGADDALAAVEEHEEQLEAGQRSEARYLLWRATGESAHLDEAKRLLDGMLANAPEEYHESMCTNVRLNREILAAWTEHCS